MITNTWEELAVEVGIASGVYATTALQLRDLAGADRLGKHVRTRISRELAARGIGTVPAEIPDRSGARVILYGVASRVGALISSLAEERTDNFLEAELRRVNTTADLPSREALLAALKPITDLASGV